MIELDGDLELTDGGRAISIVARGSEVSVELRGGGGVTNALRLAFTSRRTVRALASQFVSHGLHLTVKRGDATLLRLGDDVGTDLIGKILRIPYLAVLKKYRRS